jgi:hypothetical protein
MGATRSTDVEVSFSDQLNAIEYKLVKNKQLIGGNTSQFTRKIKSLYLSLQGSESNSHLRTEDPD